MTGATMTIHPGGIRGLHWHPHAAERQYVIAGKSQMTIFASHGHAWTDEFGVGDIAYIPQGFGHYIENIGNEDLKLLLVFNHGDFKTLDLADWLGSNPRSLEAANFGVPEELIAKFTTGGTIP